MVKVPMKDTIRAKQLDSMPYRLQEPCFFSIMDREALFKEKHNERDVISID